MSKKSYSKYKVVITWPEGLRDLCDELRAKHGLNFCDFVKMAVAEYVGWDGAMVRVAKKSWADGGPSRLARVEKCLESTQAANGSMMGKISAIKRCLDLADIPTGPEIHKRVELLALMYGQTVSEVKRLKILLSSKEGMSNG